MKATIVVSTCIIAVFAITLLTTSSYAAVDLSTAVGIWLFDEGSGDIAKDSSGNDNDATLFNGPAWVGGRFGQAVKFNGQDNCVQTGQKFLDGLEEFTIVTWINTDNLTGSRIGLVGQNDSPEFGIDPIGRVFLWTPHASVGHPYTHPDGEWHHVAAVADDEGVKVYVDGDVAAGGSPGNHGSSDFTVNIGGCGVWDADGNWFSGAMDEVAIFHSALGADSIAEIMDSGLYSMVTSVQAADKVASTWGRIKRAY